MADCDYGDFTEEKYKSLLRLAKEKYKFLTYKEVHEEDNIILWRHDIEFSVHRSLALARIEKKEGVSSTYFVQLGSVFYNVFEVEITSILEEIKSLGHNLGLHFDPKTSYIKNDIDLEKKLKNEKCILGNLLDIEIDVFSYHNPTTSNVLEYDDLVYADMINTYSKYFKENVRYCSDSNGYWRHKRLEDVLQKTEHRKLQVLTHPGWWQNTTMPPRERIRRCIEGRAKRQNNTYDKLLKDCGRENIG